LNQGESGFVQTDFTTGISSTAGDQIEPRIKDAQGLSKKDVVLALKALERFMENRVWVTAAGVDVKL
jgi:hypothetical protein